MYEGCENLFIVQPIIFPACLLFHSHPRLSMHLCTTPSLLQNILASIPATTTEYRRVELEVSFSIHTPLFTWQNEPFSVRTDHLEKLLPLWSMASFFCLYSPEYAGFYCLHIILQFISNTLLTKCLAVLLLLWIFPHIYSYYFNVLECLFPGCGSFCYFLPVFLPRAFALCFCPH